MIREESKIFSLVWRWMLYSHVRKLGEAELQSMSAKREEVV
jgi:hypothetical protein